VEPHRGIVLVAALVTTLIGSGCVDRPAGTVVPVPTAGLPSSSVAPEPSVAVSNSAESQQTACIEGEPFMAGAIAWFDGTCYGWRFAPHEVLEATGLHDRNLQLDCDPQLYGDSLETSGPPAAAHLTDLDIEFSTTPDGGSVVHVMKWACGTLGVSDLLSLTLPEGTVTIDRGLQGSPSMEVQAVDGSVVACNVAGRSAVCIDYLTADGLQSNAIAQVIVLEDATLDPHAVVLRLSSEDVPLATLLDVAERVANE
jgi:hypothetical protein